MARWSKRIDTKVSILLGLQFPLFLSPAQTRDRRPLRKGERQRILSTVGAHSVRPFLYLYAVSDTILLHISATPRRRDIPVSRNSFTRYYGRHLRIHFSFHSSIHVFIVNHPQNAKMENENHPVRSADGTRARIAQFSILHF